MNHRKADDSLFCLYFVFYSNQSYVFIPQGFELHCQKIQWSLGVTKDDQREEKRMPTTEELIIKLGN